MIKTFLVQLVASVPIQRNLDKKLLTNIQNMFALNVTVISSEVAHIYWKKINDTYKFDSDGKMEVVYRVIKER